MNVLWLLIVGTVYLREGKGGEMLNLKLLSAIAGLIALLFVFLVSNSSPPLTGALIT